MAINPAFSSTTTIVYGPLGSSTQRAGLSPVLIAPRYELYRLGATEDSSASTLLGAYNTAVSEPYAYPSASATEKIDTGSVAVYAWKPRVEVNTTALEAEKGGVNTVVFEKPIVSTSTVSSAEELRGNNISTGDTLLIKAGATSIFAAVTKIVQNEATASVAAPVAVGGGGALTAVGNGVSAFDRLIGLRVTAVTETTTTLRVSVITGPEKGRTEVVTLSGTTASALTTVAGITLARVADATYVEGDEYTLQVTKIAALPPNKCLINKTLDSSLDEAELEVTVLSDKLFTGAVKLLAGYTADSDGVTVGAYIAADLRGETYQIMETNLYAEYRALKTADTMELVDSSGAGVEDWVGTADPENPLGFMYAVAMNAARNTENTTNGKIFLMATDGEATEDYIAAINYAAQFEDAYGLVPYLQNELTQAAVVAQVNKYSTPAIAQFKCGWLVSITPEATTVYDNDIVGTVVDGVLTVALPADLIAGGVQAGDIVTGTGAYNETTGGFEERTYTVVSVTDADTCNVTGDVGVASPMSFVFTRKISNSDYADAVAAEAASWNNELIRLVWADTVNALGFTDVGRGPLAAALAAMRGSLPPHAPLSDVVIPGITIVNRRKMSLENYETMNTGGVWVVMRDSTGAAVTRHQITTRTDGTIAEEDSIVTNAHSMVRRARNANMQFRGNCNATAELVTQIRANLLAVRDSILNISYSYIYGPQLLDMSISRLEIDPNNDARIIAKVSFQVPKPLIWLDQEFNII